MLKCNRNYSLPALLKYRLYNYKVLLLYKLVHMQLIKKGVMSREQKNVTGSQGFFLVHYDRKGGNFLKLKRQF